jgi:8-oxo-dGTP diphosphatase
MKKAYGGVVINDQGLVLLREPSNHYDDYVWTFAKGRPDPKESPEETALREVREETGVKARIVGLIPGWFRGGTTENQYFLMVPVEDTKTFENETQSVRWATEMEAEGLISQTTNPEGRERDLKVLKAAFTQRKQC